jgi:hypothetical protein
MSINVGRQVNLIGFHCDSGSRHFLPPWSVEELDACYVVRDHDGQQFAYVYFEPRPCRKIADVTQVFFATSIVFVLTGSCLNFSR